MVDSTSEYEGPLCGPDTMEFGIRIMRILYMAVGTRIDGISP